MRYVRLGITSIVVFSVVTVWLITPDEAAFKRAAFYEQAASPGKLSAAHTHLQQNCAACHTPLKGVDRTKCIACHANEVSVLQRQPTAFHDNVSSCRECHREHQGFRSRPTLMDHEALVSIGLRQLKGDSDSIESSSMQRELVSWANSSVIPHTRISNTENLLKCATCHSNDDRHNELFGQNCAACHATDRWTIAEYQHPSPNSRDCAHCHQAPPSHYMKHFKMISQQVAGKHQARVDQCFECHQTTSWNDIKDVGLYKHH